MVYGKQSPPRRPPHLKPLNTIRSMVGVPLITCLFSLTHPRVHNYNNNINCMDFGGTWIPAWPREMTFHSSWCTIIPMSSCNAPKTWSVATQLLICRLLGYSNHDHQHLLLAMVVDGFEWTAGMWIAPAEFSGTLISMAELTGFPWPIVVWHFNGHLRSISSKISS